MKKDETPEHPRVDAESHRPKGRTQKTPKEGYVIPVPTEDQFMSDLKKASRKRGR